MKPVSSALPRLLPARITNTRTGRVLTWDEFATEALTPLTMWVVGETERLYEADPAGAREAARGLKFNAAEYARQHGYVADTSALERAVKAKSRIQRLVGHKLMTELASYERNPNPRKQPGSFSRTLNLGAVDSQMARLERDGSTLILTWKCWENEYELVFLLPHYLQTRIITKWSLPVVSEHGAIFAYQETPVPVTGPNTAGVDLGRVEPFTLAVVSAEGSLLAEYRARAQIKRANAKRERILKEVKRLTIRARAYDALGLDPSLLREEARRKRNKASRIGASLASQTAADITQKITRHQVSVLNIENLKWATGAKYGSRWVHGQTSSKIEHTAARAGVRTKRVNPRNTSQVCHSCGTRITHNTKKRTVRCAECKITLDRDMNAALNIAKHKNTGPRAPIAGATGRAIGITPGASADSANPVIHVT